MCVCVRCLCCCSAIVTGDKALLFEPASNNTRKLLDALVPRLQVGEGAADLLRRLRRLLLSSGHYFLGSGR